MEELFVSGDKGKLPCLTIMGCLSISVQRFRCLSAPRGPSEPTGTATTFNFQSVHMSEINLAKILRLPIKHSSGPDWITYVMLKLLLPAIVRPLVRLFNFSLQLGEVPKGCLVEGYSCYTLAQRWEDAFKESVELQANFPDIPGPAWPGFLRKPSTCKSESILRWTNSFLRSPCTLVFYRSTPQLPYVVLPNPQMDNGHSSKAVHPSGVSELEKGTREPTAGLVFLSSTGVGSLRILWNRWSPFWQIVGRELKSEICTPCGQLCHVKSLRVDLQCWDQLVRVSLPVLYLPFHLI